MKYVVAIHHPVGYDGSGETEERVRAIDDLNREMVDAGVRFVVGGLGPSSNARALRLQADGEILVTDGPFSETKEIIGGFWILDVADLDEALEWGKKAVVACGTTVEIRDFYGSKSEHPLHQDKAQK
jgi:hypothetical protein